MFWRPRLETSQTCAIDLYAGVSTTPVEMVVEDKKPDFLERVRIHEDFRPGNTQDRSGFSPGELYPGRDVRG